MLIDPIDKDSIVWAPLKLSRLRNLFKLSFEIAFLEILMDLKLVHPFIIL